MNSEQPESQANVRCHTEWFLILIDADEEKRLPLSAKIDSVMRNLLWNLEVANYRDLAMAGLDDAA